MRRLLIKVILFSFISVILSCSFAPEREVYKYLEFDRLPYIKKIHYSDKKVYNNIIIEFQSQNEYGDLNILCIPNTQNEYEKYLEKRLKKYELRSKQEFITLLINGRKIKGIKTTIDSENCYIHFYDYYEGMAISFSYFGNCDNIVFLNNILSSIKYRISEKKVQQARRDFLHVMNSIEKLDIPIYNNASNIQSEYNEIIEPGRRLEYDIEIEAFSERILDYYKDHFSKLSWRPIKSKYIGKWHNDKLFYEWIDATEEIIASLIILQGKNRPKKMPKQSIHIVIFPYLVMEWGHRVLQKCE